MITITGNGHITRSPELRSTNSDKAVTTVSIASNGRNRDDAPQYLDLILWEKQATNAVEYLEKGQSVSFTGRLEVRTYKRSDGEPGVALEVHGAQVEYGAKKRAPDSEPTAVPA
jgi:single-strand DNA-binding protein